MSAYTADELGAIFVGALTEVVSKVTGFSFTVMNSERDAGSRDSGHCYANDKHAALDWPKSLSGEFCVGSGELRVESGEFSGASALVLNEDFVGDFVGAMNLNSKKSGMLFISADERDMRVFCSYMIGVAVDDVTMEDITDVLCELVNMTAGNAKALLSDSDYMYSLSSPFALCGNDLSLIFKKRANVISKVLGNGDISIRLRIVY